MGRICGSALLMLACSSTAGHAQACRWVRPDSSFVRAKVDTFSRGGFGTGEDLGLQYDTIQLYVDHDCETAVVIDWGAGGGALVILRSDGRVVYSNAYDNMEVHRGAGRTHVAISFRAVRGTGIGASRFVVLCGFAMDVWSECLDIEQDREEALYPRRELGDSTWVAYETTADVSVSSDTVRVHRQVRWSRMPASNGRAEVRKDLGTTVFLLP